MRTAGDSPQQLRPKDLDTRPLVQRLPWWQRILMEPRKPSTHRGSIRYRRLWFERPGVMFTVGLVAGVVVTTAAFLLLGGV